MSHTLCNKQTCIHYKDGHCTLSNPEKVGEDCLDFEDTMDFLSLKADPHKRNTRLNNSI